MYFVAIVSKMGKRIDGSLLPNNFNYNVPPLLQDVNFTSRL